MSEPDPDLITTAGTGDPWRALFEIFWSLPGKARLTYLGDGRGSGMVAELSNKMWLDLAYYRSAGSFWWNSWFLLSLAVTPLISLRLRAEFVTDAETQ